MKSLLRVAPLALAAALIVPIAAPSAASASPVDQQRQRVEDIVDELERLQEQANQLGADYVEAVDTKTQLDEDIEASEKRIAKKEAELETLRANLGEMALRSFVGSGGSPLGPLFEEAEDLSDVLQREELARVALSAGDVSTDQLDALVSDLDEERSDLESNRDEAEQLAEYLESQQDATETRTQEYQEARTEAEAELGRVIQEEEERRARESAERLAAEVAAAEAAAAQEAANNASSSSSSSNSSSSDSSSNSSSGSSSSNSSSGSSSGSSSSGSSSSGSSSSGSSSSGSSSSGSSSGGSSGGSSAPAVSSLSGIAVNAALAQQGVPYRYATAVPGVGFDCSGLTSYAWSKAGVYLPHQSRSQYASVPHVSSGSAQPGDLLFYYSPISHVGIYLGGGQQVHAPNTGSVVSVASVNWGKVSGVGRPG